MIIYQVLFFMMNCFYAIVKHTEGFNESDFRFKSNVDYLYHYSTDVHMDHKIWAGSEETRHKRNSDASFHLYARLNVTSLWKTENNDKHLLRIELKEPRFLNTTNSHSMIDCVALNTLIRYPAMALWESGTITQVYFNENDDLASINFKKGIMSLFQYKQDNTSEVDTLGRCATEYRVFDDHLVKDKYYCTNIQYNDEYTSLKTVLNYTLDFQSTCVYTFENSTLKTCSCSDLAFPKLNVPQVAGFRVMSRLSIYLIEKVSNDKHQIFSTMGGALKTILSITPDQYHPLETEKQIHPCDDYCEKFDEFIKDHEQYLHRKSLGNRTTGTTFLQLISLIRRQNERTLANTLNNATNSIKFTLIEAYIAGQTQSSINVVLKHLDNDKSKNKELIECFLMAAAFTPRPSELLFEQLMNRSKNSDYQIETSTYLTLGAIVHKIYHSNKKSLIIDNFTKFIQNSLKEHSKTKNAKRLVYLSLYNAKIDLYQNILINEIKSCSETDLCWLALSALTQLDCKTLSTEVISLIRSLYHEHNKRTYGIQIRQLAGLILLKTDISVPDFLNIILSTLDKSNHQLGLYMWRVIDTMTQNDELLARKLKFIINQQMVVFSFDSLAYKGQSDYYRRTLLTTYGFGVYYTVSQLMSKVGALKESDFTVNIQQYDAQDDYELLSFGVSAQGLESYITDDVDESDQNAKDEELHAQLRINILNTQLRPVELFSGVTGLMGAVWSAPSELTSAFRSNLMIHDLSRYIHLHNGVIVHYEAQSAVSLDLSGMASISLWNKNSHSVIRVSTGFSVRSHIDILSDFITTGINSTLSTNTIVDYTTDVDYSDSPIRVCMQMAIQPTQVHDNIENFYSIKRTKSYRWFGNRTLKYPGTDYPFTEKNNQMCQLLHKS